MIDITIQDSSGHEDTHHLTINIINVNEYSPVFTRTVYDAGELAENSLGGTVVATVSASDADAGDLGNIEYAIDEEPSRTFFKVFHFYLIFKFKNVAWCKPSCNGKESGCSKCVFFRFISGRHCVFQSIANLLIQFNSSISLL